ncbi:MAG: glycoside hydrolase/phage tail family protein [Hyphomicrobium zavarzinii]|uniref:baseplate multidomain protein megatron n=1 Tax=Hyphomicrobium zavarzinii TaxID=48292 RepID=UPI001A3E30E8|nr:glycoside hydrolase/phage tail family protein [Hyphomicrobium zavarzinii]MBL8844444.1 glycoside hydrolase/phage tail family protein [Hyphomicrobium zavarzinii]
MATLALAVAGAAAGSALLPTGVSMLGLTLSGAAIGSQIGAFAGSYIDNALFGSSGQRRTVEGPRLSDLHITASTEGAPIPRLYGRARLGGQIIWADEIRERVITSRSGGSSKGAAPSTPVTQTVEYRYSASFAVALAEGPINGIGRVWVDGAELDLAQVRHRVYLGTEAQLPDPTIAAIEGAGLAPAYRGIAYIVFEDMALADYGNRIPQLSFEVHRAVEPFGEEIKGIVLIPGSGEFVYAPNTVSKQLGRGVSEAENVHTRQGGTDWSVAVDQLQATLPNATSVSLVVSWFGTDLRAGHCEIKPGVETTTKSTTPMTWSVAGLARNAAHLVSTKDERPAYGGTPSDASVIEAIQDLKARGMSVVLTPFILMDVPDGNALPDPHSAAASQPSYPWRGRITCSPAPGRPGTPDKTATAASQIASFVGTASIAHFSISGGSVVYSGPAEWSFRRMVLHHAFLAKAAGGVDAFVIGTELRGLTQVRSAASTYPFVAALVALAADVKSVLGSGTKVLYAADWSEYFGHQPGDGSGDVYFHLDPLWTSSAIDAIGIDLYWPLSDWRDGTSHLDYVAGTRSIYDEDYLRANVQGGEGFDWYYASDADREAQIRSPLTDGDGAPWVFRYKDIKSWWQNQHFNRPGGVPSGSPTAWVPQSKPFWFMEIGCPAVDKGANQPNVFVDPKSAESAFPYFSRGARDDLIQRRFLKALIDTFDPASEGYVSGQNPVSAVTGQRMVDLSRIHVYCWDARPFPAFPYNTDVWGDGDNWRFGHWLNGRFSVAPLPELVDAILADYGITGHDASRLAGVVPGYVIDRLMSPRDALQPLELAYFFDSLESEGRILFRHRGAEPPVLSVTESKLVEERAGDALLTLTRSQETDLPASAKVSHIAATGDYRQAVSEARRLTGASGRVARAELPIVLEHESASQIADAWLFETWASRERALFKLPPSAIDIEPGDIVSVVKDGTTMLVRVTEIGERGVREIEGRSIDPEIYAGAAARPRDIGGGETVFDGVPHVEFLDLPLLRGDEPAEAGYAAAFQSPWPGGVALFSSPEDAGYALRALASAPAIMGETLHPLPSGPIAVVDRGARLSVRLSSGELASVTRLQMLAGRNAAAIRNEAGGWEVLQFETATLVGEATYELSNLLRGQGGTEREMRNALPAGATFVLLGGEIARVDLTAGEIGAPLYWRFGPANRDIADRSYATEIHTFTGRGLMPLSPAHVRGARTGGGDITISWKRRTRVGGDSWDAAEVPLAEEGERYEIDVLSGSTVKRTITATAQSCVYSTAEQVADFGAAQSALSVAVYQMSATRGRGTPKAAVV